jgi:ribosome maturation factor RimP
MSANGEQLWARFEEYLAAESLDLDDIEVTGGGKGKVIRVTVDGADGVDVGRLARLSRGMARMLDEDEPFADAYTLEVTSPGLERKLRRPSHYAKSIGRVVVATTTTEVDGATAHRGTIVAADDDGFVVEVNGTNRTIRFDEVAKARTVFEWGAKPKPGTKSG